MNDIERRLSGGLREITDLVSRTSAPDTVRALRPAPAPRRRALVPAAAAIAVVLAGGTAGGIMNSRTHDQDPTVVVAGEGASSLPAVDPALTGAEPDASARHFAVDDTAERIAAFTDRPGFGQTSLNYDAGSVTVFWKGTPPGEIADMVGINDDGIRVVVVPANYSAQETIAAATAVMRSFPKDVTGAGANRDMTGLVVEVRDTWSGSTADLEKTASMPVTTKTRQETGDSPVPPPLRQP